MANTQGIGTLIPAYTDYKSAKAVQEAWDANKDFRITSMFHPDSGRVCNKQDLGEYKPVIRYSKGLKLMTIK